MPLQMPALKLSRRAGKILAGIALTLLILAALSAWLVPKAVHHVLTQNTAELLGRPVNVGKIRFNPFTLALSAKDLVIEQPQSAPLLQIREIDLRVAWRSIVLFAPVLDRSHIDQPRLALVRQDPRHFNFSDIIERLDKAPAEQPAKPAATGLPRFSVNNLSVTGGAISLDDHVTGRQQTITDFTLGIPFISSLSYATKTDVQPVVHMLINGSPFDLTGTARPFDTVPASTLNVTLDGLALDKWADFWPLPLPVKMKSALLDSNLQVLFEQPQDAAPRIRIQGGLGLRTFDVAESSGAPLVAWDDLKIQGLAADLGARTASIDTVILEKPRVEAHRDARQLNWQRVAEGFAKLGSPAPAKPEGANPAAHPATAGATADAPASPVPAWKVAIGTFRLDDGEAHLRDDPIKLDYSLKGLGVEVQHITVPQAVNQPMAAQLTMNNPTDGSSLQVQAPIVLQPLSIQAQVRLDKLALAPFAAAVRHFAPITLQNGRLSLEGKVDLANSQVEAHNVKLSLQQFAARDDSVKPGVNVSIGSMAL
ncbi:MAG TPA: DUF748 domain-containing protein, partial [Castellaniella sp.]|nr:DUF748 domain-containing protein [Castellaniella sp.]